MQARLAALESLKGQADLSADPAARSLIAEAELRLTRIQSELEGRRERLSAEMSEAEELDRLHSRSADISRWVEETTVVLEEPLPLKTEDLARRRELFAALREQLGEQERAHALAAADWEKRTAGVELSPNQNIGPELGRLREALDVVGQILNELETLARQMEAFWVVILSVDTEKERQWAEEAAGRVADLKLSPEIDTETAARVVKVKRTRAELQNDFSLADPILCWPPALLIAF